jgi:AAA family ATP:ADP antiporter
MVGGRWVFQTLGWRAAASATPLAMLLSGGAFFGLSLAAHFGVSVAGLGPLQMAYAGVAAGAATQVFARSSKFSLFDPAKEMVYIEMSKEEKSKGKAAVDLLGSQIGKSGGAWTTQLLLLLTGTLAASLPFVSVIFVGVLVSWLAAVGNLNTQLKEYEAEKAAAEAGGGSSTSSSGDNGGAGTAVPAAVQPQAA